MYVWLIARAISVFVIAAVLAGHEDLIRVALFMEGLSATVVSMAVILVGKRLDSLSMADWKRVAQARAQHIHWIQVEHLSTAVLGIAVVILLAVKGYYPLAALSLLSLGLLAWLYYRMDEPLKQVKLS